MTWVFRVGWPSRTSGKNRLLVRRYATTMMTQISWRRTSRDERIGESMVMHVSIHALHTGSLKSHFYCISLLARQVPARIGLSFSKD